MKKYRDRVPPGVPRVRPAPKPMKRVDFGQMAQHYRIGDMVDNSNIDLAHGRRTVDEEFEAYTTANFDEDAEFDHEILAFWEVSIPTTHYHSRLEIMLHRKMKTASPHFTQLHWTIYLSRAQQFHVSAFSLRVRKRTPSGAIELILSSWRPCKFLSSL